jgi:hypothetical protein
MLTAPDNPYVVLFAAAMPLFGQLFRNHEEVIKQLPEVRRQAKKRRKEQKETIEPKNLTIHLPFNRKVSFRVRFNPFRNLRLRAPSRHPAELVAEVFSDPRVHEALRKQGITIVEKTV